MLKLPGHTRYAYSPIVERKDYNWPGGKRLAFYIALNIEHFAFGGLGMDPVRSGKQTTRNFAQLLARHASNPLNVENALIRHACPSQ
jgi:allantoinase